MSGDVTSFQVRHFQINESWLIDILLKIYKNCFLLHFWKWQLFLVLHRGCFSLFISLFSSLLLTSFKHFKICPLLPSSCWKIKLKTFFLNEHFIREGEVISAVRADKYTTAAPSCLRQQLPSVQSLQSIGHNSAPCTWLINPYRGSEFCYKEVHLKTARICRILVPILDAGKSKDEGLEEELTIKKSGNHQAALRQTRHWSSCHLPTSLQIKWQTHGRKKASDIKPQLKRNPLRG